MINSKFGDEHVVEMILQHVAALEKLESRQEARSASSVKA
jgi:hypothetical protein